MACGESAISWSTGNRVTCSIVDRGVSRFARIYMKHSSGNLARTSGSNSEYGLLADRVIVAALRGNRRKKAKISVGED
jgi:hypothetical protein